MLSAVDWQRTIYLNGFRGKHNSVPADFRKLRKAAQRQMTAEGFAYIDGGAGCEITIKANSDAFCNYSIVPRALTNVSDRDISIQLFGQQLPAPLLLAPIGVLDMAHPDADVAVGQAAAQTGIPFIFSNQASKPMEEVAAAMGTAPRWFQLYWSKSNDLVASFVRRAEASGCSAIVVTVDTTLLGWRTRDIDMSYLPFLHGRGIAQYTSDPVFQQLLDSDPVAPPERKISFASLKGLVAMVRNYPGERWIQKLRSGRPVRAVQKFIDIYSNPALQWTDLKFLRQHTRLPILLKGILHQDDALKAIDYGIDGIVVSNHGGRQVDGAIATLAALPGVVQAVKGRIPVLLDSGIRGGADVFKAVALGATAVCIGRPYAFGLSIAGARGVYEVIRNLVAEFELTMALAGCRSIEDIKGSTIIRR